jgi:outer membrane protein OmpA-like peptidoglycan-associated protein
MDRRDGGTAPTEVSGKPDGLGYRATLVAVALLCGSPVAADADGESSFSVRSAVGLSTMVSSDQLDTLGYDQVGFMGDALLAYSVLPWLDPYGGITASAFVASPYSTGGLLAPNAGLMASIRADGFRPYAQTDIGVGFTGAIVRPLYRAGLGIDIQLSREIAFGPALGYGQLFQTDEPGKSTDARFFWAGFAVQYRHWREQKKAAGERVAIVRQKRPHPAPPPPPVEASPELMKLIEQTIPTARVELLAPVLFEFDSDELEPIGVAMLHEVAGLLQHRQDIELVEIQGYADDRGSPAYNRALSEKRALRVQQWLVEHGVHPDRLRVAGWGAGFPVESGGSETAHQQNRRVVFRVVRLGEP